MDNLLVFWLMASILFLCIELINPGFFYFASFFCGALAAAATTLFDVNVIDQAAVFVVSTVLFFFLLKACVKKWGTTSHYQSNMYALQGKRGFVVTPVSATKFGYIHVAGELWACKTNQQQDIEAGVLVEVVSVKGAHLVVIAVESH